RAGDRGGDRDGREVADAVTVDEDRRRVRADRHERAVPERDLAGVAEEQVQAEDRHEVGADGRELRGAEVRQHDRQHDEQQHGSGCEERAAVHVRPVIAVGRTSSATSRTANAVARRSSPSTQSTYAPSRFTPTPTTMPPAAAPRRESAPPSTAAANA